MTTSDQKEIILKILEDRRSISSSISAKASYNKSTSGLVADAESLDKVLIAFTQPKHVPMQRCPLCKGTGNECDAAGPIKNTTCSVCNGDKIIPHRVLNESAQVILTT